MIKAWKAVDVPFEKPATRKGFVTPAQIEEYALLNICRIKERDCNLVLLEEALLLRIQSARSHRHVNLLAVKWSLDCNFFFIRIDNVSLNLR